MRCVFGEISFQFSWDHRSNRSSFFFYRGSFRGFLCEGKRRKKSKSTLKTFEKIDVCYLIWWRIPHLVINQWKNKRVSKRIVDFFPISWLRILLDTCTNLGLFAELTPGWINAYRKLKSGHVQICESENCVRFIKKKRRLCCYV